MNTTISEIESSLTDNEPDRTSGKMDDAQKTELRRENTLVSLDVVEGAVLNDQPVTRVRQTEHGPVSYQTDMYFRKGNTINFRLKVGLKSLSINGKKTFTSSTPKDALHLIEKLRQAVKDGVLDDCLRALYEIPPDTLRRMQDMKAINRLAKAKAAGKTLATADRIKLERLLRIPAYRDAYSRPVLALMNEDDLFHYRMASSIPIDEIREMERDAFDRLYATNKNWADASSAYRADGHIKKVIDEFLRTVLCGACTGPVKQALLGVSRTAAESLDALKKTKRENQKARSKPDYTSAKNAFAAAFPDRW